MTALVHRLRAQLRIPLLRDGYALVLNSGLTALMGAVYWLVAAHKFSTHAVGVNSAAISAMMFLAGVAQLNLMSALLRFVPVSGASTRRLVVSCYAVATALGAVAGLVFVLGVRRWSPHLGFLLGPGYLAWFVASTMAWCIFNLQDSVLTGLGRAILVPVENQVFSTAKIVLLLVLATSSPRYGIFASWTAALIFSVVPVNLLIFKRLLPAHAREGAGRRPPPRTQLTRYVSADSFASLWWLAATALMPVIVFGLKGAEPTAWFSLAWMVALPLFLMSISGGAALVVSGAREEQRLDQYARQARRLTLLLVTPAALVLAVLAPYVLDLFGPQYSAGATATLRLLCLAAIPNAVVALAVSARRVRRHVRAVVAITASQCALVLVLSVVLLSHGGVVGVGVAWLVASTVVAAAVVAIDAGGLRLLSWLIGTPGHRRRTRHAAGFVPAIVGGLAGDGEPAWTVHRSLRTVTDMAVLTIGPPGECPRALIKFATSPSAARSLEREGAALRAVRADDRLGTWRDLIPDVLAHGGAGGSPYLVEHLLPGSTGPASTRLVESAAAAIAPLHRATAAEIVAGPDCVRRWIEGPLGTLAHTGSDRVVTAAVDRLACDLGGALLGKRLTVSWIHGDYVPSNILVDRATARVTGIVDWELARPADLPLVDIVSLLLAARMQSTHNELGRVVSDWLAGAQWTADEQRIVDAVSVGLPGEAIDGRALVLLCWLRHVSGNLGKASRYATHDRWRRGNVVPVARAVARS